MKLTISNIAIEAQDFIKTVDFLKKTTNKLEIAPVSLNEDFFNNIKIYQDVNKKIQLHAIQSIFFQQQNIGLQNKDQFTTTVNFMSKLFKWCDDLQIKSIVFGNPKMKHYTNETEKSNIDLFFIKMEELLNNYTVKLLIEPNPQDYGSNYLTTHTEVIEYIKKHNFKNVLTMIDCSTIILNNENLEFITLENLIYIKHVHLSAPFLKLDINNDVAFDLFNKVLEKLKAVNYQEVISIEMVKPEPYNINKVFEIYTKIANMI